MNQGKKRIIQDMGVEGCVVHIMNTYIYVCIPVYKLYLCMHTNCGTDKLLTSKLEDQIIHITVFSRVMT